MAIERRKLNSFFLFQKSFGFLLWGVVNMTKYMEEPQTQFYTIRFMKKLLTQFETYKHQ